MQLAADVGVMEKKTKLKGKVRTFLDQKVCLYDRHTGSRAYTDGKLVALQAIHFHGADTTKSRTKRTRHP